MMKTMMNLWLISVCLTIMTFAFGEDERFKDLDKYVKPADHPLSSEEVERMTKLIIKALQGNRDERMNAVEELGYEIGHKAAIPVIVLVVNNPKEDGYIRSVSIQVLANIPDKDVLIQLLKIVEEGVKRKERLIYDTVFYVLHRLLHLYALDIKEKPPKEILEIAIALREERKKKEEVLPEKQLAYYKMLWEWQKDKPIDMRKRVYVMKMRSWH